MRRKKYGPVPPPPGSEAAATQAEILAEIAVAKTDQIINAVGQRNAAAQAAAMQRVAAAEAFASQAVAATD